MTTALITGASAGLGLEYARLFAADKHDLVLVARRKERLEALGAELAKQHGVRVHVVTADLEDPRATDHVVAEVARLGVSIDFLVNNAGFGTTGAIDASDPKKQAGMVHVNVTALTALTCAFLPAMVARRSGRILNVGSTAAFQPGPFMSVYYATKAYVQSFTEGLAYELRGTGVTATVSCPGPTQTEFGAVSGVSESRLFKMGLVATSASVAREGYRAMLSGRTMVVHGWMNWFVMQSVRITPRALMRAIAGVLNRPAAGAKQLQA